MVKNSFAHEVDIRDSFDPWVGKVCWRRAWQPTPEFLPAESHGQRSLQVMIHAGKESDAIEVI